MHITFFETPFTADDVDYDKSRFSTLEEHFNRLITEKKIRSANFCLSRYGKVFASGAIGDRYTKDDNRAELRPDTPNRICSISKIMCSVAIFKLIEDGRLRGNQPVAEILIEMNKHPFNTITIAQLLSHTSGIYPDDNCFSDAYRLTPWQALFGFYDGKFPQYKSFVEAVMAGGMRTKPGEEWAYCTVGFILLGEVIARVTGMPCDKYLEDALFKPLEMKDTGSVSWYDGSDKTKKYRESIIERADCWNKWTKKIMCAMNDVDFEHLYMPPTGNGIYSTSQDLVKFGNMLLNKGSSFDGVRILGESAIERMTEPYTSADIKEYCWGAGGVHRDYGLGPDLRRSADNLDSQGTFYHEGAGACALVIDPVRSMVAAWFIPFADDNWYPEALYNTANVMWSGIKTKRKM